MPILYGNMELAVDCLWPDHALKSLPDYAIPHITKVLLCGYLDDLLHGFDRKNAAKTNNLRRIEAFAAKTPKLHHVRLEVHASRRTLSYFQMRFPKHSIAKTVARLSQSSELQTVAVHTYQRDDKRNLARIIETTIQRHARDLQTNLIVCRVDNLGRKSDLGYRVVEEEDNYDYDDIYSLGAFDDASDFK